MDFYKNLKFSISKNFNKPTISSDLSFTEGVNEFLTKELHNYKSYLEYGSGASTVFFSKYEYLNIVAVESDAVYANQVKIAIGNNGRTRILHSGTGPTGLWGYPILFANTANKGWKYVNTPWRSLGEEYQPDVVLIDGRYRVACAMNILLRAANKFKVTIMIDDYQGREEYIYVEKYCKLIRMVDRMAFFEYNMSPLKSQIIEELKKDLALYLKKAE